MTLGKEAAARLLRGEPIQQKQQPALPDNTSLPESVKRQVFAVAYGALMKIERDKRARSQNLPLFGDTTEADKCTVTKRGE